MKPGKMGKPAAKRDQGRRRFNVNNNDAKAQDVMKDKNKNKRSKNYIIPGTGKKAKSTCSACGLIGHWYTDDICPGRKNGDKNDKNSKDSSEFFQ